MRIPVLILLIQTSLLLAQSPDPDRAPEPLAGYRLRLSALNEAIKAQPPSVALLSQRGDCHLFLGEFAEAVRDFETMIQLDPSQDAPHWRLGIAYHFCGQWEKSARQFEKYHTYDGRDRENGIWKFLADAKRMGLERARSEMLVYKQFDREPFPSLYAMFAGKKTGADVLEDLEKRGLGNDPTVMFFAHYYAGLNEELLGNRARARELLRKAASAFASESAAGSPGYMWLVARLHAKGLEAEAPKP
jgi:lipoprotein NlpI